ncbi:hypothetical protein XELAEV_18045499mg [Xenopus laevis]|uniref:Uncharacterized protein n=1 Tax=Xenopus laevis TaxID=8355 RepID=A0A974C1K8_XENLA|nr:hypothetical protein XELAEV_18045499mg [Xenopus laevis]
MIPLFSFWPCALKSSLVCTDRWVNVIRHKSVCAIQRRGNICTITFSSRRARGRSGMGLKTHPGISSTQRPIK